MIDQSMIDKIKEIWDVYKRFDVHERYVMVIAQVDKITILSDYVRMQSKVLGSVLEYLREDTEKPSA